MFLIIRENGKEKRNNRGNRMRSDSLFVFRRGRLIASGESEQSGMDSMTREKSKDVVLKRSMTKIITKTGHFVLMDGVNKTSGE